MAEQQITNGGTDWLHYEEWSTAIGDKTTWTYVEYPLTHGAILREYFCYKAAVGGTYLSPAQKLDVVLPFTPFNFIRGDITNYNMVNVFVQYNASSKQLYLSMGANFAYYQFKVVLKPTNAPSPYIMGKVTSTKKNGDCAWLSFPLENGHDLVFFQYKNPYLASPTVFSLPDNLGKSVMNGSMIGNAQFSSFYTTVLGAALANTIPPSYRSNFIQSDTSNKFVLGSFTFISSTQDNDKSPLKSSIWVRPGGPDIGKYITILYVDIPINPNVTHRLCFPQYCPGGEPAIPYLSPTTPEWRSPISIYGDPTVLSIASTGTDGSVSSVTKITPYSFAGSTYPQMQQAKLGYFSPFSLFYKIK